MVPRTSVTLQKCYFSLLIGVRGVLCASRWGWGAPLWQLSCCCWWRLLGRRWGTGCFMLPQRPSRKRVLQEMPLTGVVSAKLLCFGAIYPLCREKGQQPFLEQAPDGNGRSSVCLPCPPLSTHVDTQGLLCSLPKQGIIKQPKSKHPAEVYV